MLECFEIHFFLTISQIELMLNKFKCKMKLTNVVLFIKSITKPNVNFLLQRNQTIDKKKQILLKSRTYF